MVTTIQVSEELADELHERKGRGETYEDVVRELMDVPGEHRVDCGECGFDGGTYDYKVEPSPPAYCPQCGTAVEESDRIYVPPADEEPTSLSYRSATGE